MSWLYLPEQVAGCSPANGCLAGERSATSKIQHTPSRCSKRESETGCSTTRPSGTMLEHSTGDPGVDAWISSLRASRASPGPLEEKTGEKMILATFGRTPFALLERPSPRGYCWRTPQTCFSSLINETAHRISSELLRSWPAWGMWAGGAAYPQEQLDWTTNGDGCGLLPTPLTRDGKSFYVCTKKTALRVMQNKPLHQLHWSQFGIVYHDLKKGWANPRFSELMMGWPTGWTDLQPLGRDKFQQWLESLGSC